jgi:hypothetical protein
MLAQLKARSSVQTAFNKDEGGRSCGGITHGVMILGVRRKNRSCRTLLVDVWRNSAPTPGSEDNTGTPDFVEDSSSRT